MAKSTLRKLTPLEEEVLHTLKCSENYFKNLSFERNLTDHERSLRNNLFDAIDKIMYKPKK